MSPKLFLKWSEFCNNIHTSLGGLRETDDFADVTLACEDGHQVEAHQVILAASSPFFRNLLKRKKHAHPLIFMRGVKYEDLLGIVDFLYYGEANISQENLESFLAIADELQMDGLMKNGENEEEGQSDKEVEKFLEDDEEEKLYGSKSHEPQQLSDSKTEASKTTNLIPSLDQLEEMINSKLLKSDRKMEGRREKWVICKVCGKEGQGVNIRNHIESNHLQGIVLSCNLCGEIFKTKRTLAQHKLSTHSKPIKDGM